MKILALNKSYLPIRLISKFNCIGKMYTNMAVALYFKGDTWEEKNWDEWLEMSKKDVWPEDQEFIGATTQRVAIPKAVKYTCYDRIPKVTTKLSRKSIYERDHFTCYICGEKFSEGKLSIDHMNPLSRGGGNTWENMVTCCKQCNWKKGHQLLSELGIKPKFLPKKPNISNIQKLKASVAVHQKEWELFGL